MKRPRSSGHFARIAAVTLVLGLLAILAPARSTAHDDDLGEASSARNSPRGSLDGTWRLVAPPLGAGREQYKTIAGGHFIWYVVAEGRIVGSAGGRMFLRDGVYVERIDFAGSPEIEWMVGGTGRFTVERRGERWHHEGVVTAADEGMHASVDEEWLRMR